MRPSRRSFLTDKPSEAETRPCLSGVVRELGQALEKLSEGLSGERSRERNEIPDRAKRARRLTVKLAAMVRVLHHPRHARSCDTCA